MNHDRRDPRSDRVGLKHRLRYRFDNMLARGTSATLLWLGILSVLVVAASGLLLWLFRVGFTGSEDTSYLEEFWQSLLRVMDPGTMAGDVGWGRRLLALMITVFGLLVAGTLIGVIAAGVETRIERMRRGRSLVVESGHIVVLGASDRLPVLVRQLVLARSGRADSVIVVMTDGDAAETQEEVGAAVTDRMGSRLVFRSGDTTRRSDLALTRLHRAEQIIVLTDGSTDARALRTVIAAREELEGHAAVPIVVELDDLSSAQSLASAYPSDVHAIVASQAIGRIASFALRQPGLGEVALALLDDRGSDVHVCDVPELEGRPFGDALSGTPDARPIGIMARNGATRLNPSSDERFEPGDRLIAISDSPVVQMRVNGESEENRPAVGAPAIDLSIPDQRVLVIGWSELGAAMLADWASVAGPQSMAEVLCDADLMSGADLTIPDGGPSYRVTPSAHLGDIESRLPQVDSVLILADPRLGDDESDTQTLLLTAALRRMIDNSGSPSPRLIIELANEENFSLAATIPRDLVISQAIGSQLIAQLAELPDRRPVFLDLYDPTTASIRLVAPDALGLSGRVRAFDIYLAARAAGLSAIGWRFSNALDHGLVLNAAPSVEVNLKAADHVIVIG